jgi:hypothetical protein
MAGERSFSQKKVKFLEEEDSRNLGMGERSKTEDKRFVQRQKPESSFINYVEGST